MPKLPILTGREIIRILEQLGFEKRNQTGSHVHLVGADKEGLKRLVTIPYHGNKEIPIGTLLSIIRQSGFRRDEFFKYGK
ncbi:MAG: type II toxin-antitoxin system HicA family toxin [Candidatus Aenigmarchaeota archaeon]|nr:type II toxin-antitoxin system HicA family toxin [Candidatus Aenigmarchaeota archaeon]